MQFQADKARRQREPGEIKEGELVFEFEPRGRKTLIIRRLLCIWWGFPCLLACAPMQAQVRKYEMGSVTWTGLDRGAHFTRKWWPSGRYQGYQARRAGARLDLLPLLFTPSHLLVHQARHEANGPPALLPSPRDRLLGWRDWSQVLFSRSLMASRSRAFPSHPFTSASCSPHTHSPVLPYHHHHPLFLRKVFVAIMATKLVPRLHVNFF